MDVATIDLNIGNTQRGFSYRRSTADEGLIAQVLMNSCFNFSRLRRGKELADLYERLVRTGKAPLVIDVGANIGASALYFAFSFSKARVVAIEPEQSKFDLLVANTTGLAVECLHAAVGTSAGVLSAIDSTEDRECRVAPLTDARKATDHGSCVTISEILENHSQDTLPFITKIDVGSSDNGSLFATNIEWITGTPVIIIALRDCLIPGSDAVHKFVECIADQNRDFVYLHDNIFSIDRNLPVT